MRHVVIENPVLNSPFREPSRHFRFGPEGITDEVVEGRRESAYFIPIPPAKGKPGTPLFDTGWTEDRLKPNDDVNRIRARVNLWRGRGWPGVTPTTRRLLEYWTDPKRERRLFFCQIEAVETAIYLTEAAVKSGDGWIENLLRDHNATGNDGLPRTAFKMATGAGKTVVMAMLIAWQALNKIANTKDGRFSDTFLVVTPGITIRDRLRVLLPNQEENYYRERDVLPSEDIVRLEQARILVTNFHAFLPRETWEGSKLGKQILARGADPAGRFAETPDQVVRRVCRAFGGKQNVVVINDEAHHCYRRKPDPEDEHLDRDERAEAQKREKDARVWFNGLKAVQGKLGIRSIFDLSATPFFLRGSGYRESEMFPWVVSDFSLIDAIEAGIVKVPRVPVADDAHPGESPTYRDLWLRVREGLSRKGRGAEVVHGDPKPPAELEGALQSLYGNYAKHRRIWEDDPDTKAKDLPPPVFIVVCSNTSVSKLVFDHIAGYEKVGHDGKPVLHPDGSPVLVPGALPFFSNVKDGRWVDRPNTILVDSEELESGEGMSPEFRRIAAREIEEFKGDYARRTGRDPEDLTDEDVLREVMNTVGKRGKLGERVSCVVSVSMLTEGWDANTVTHVLGVRKFGTQLLCEQVVGRALRRRSYPAGLDTFPPEYAEVYGVPFSFIPTSGSQPNPTPGPPVTHVRALPERIASEITFPRVLGYRWEVADGRLAFRFTEDACLALSAHDVPTRVETSDVIGGTSVHTLDDLRARRRNEVAFLLAKRVLESRLPDGEGAPRPWLFPQVLAIAKRWLDECLTLKDGTFEQLLLFRAQAERAADCIYRAILQGAKEPGRLRPILQPYDTVGSTRWVDFDTTRPVWPTRADKCHVSHVVCDTTSWEQKAAQSLEEMPEVRAYVKNHNLRFTIPYALDGEERQYVPDFLVRFDDGQPEPLNLILEVTGERREDKKAKVWTAKALWVPAINAHGGYGRWAFVEVADPWDLRGSLHSAITGGVLFEEPPSPLSMETA